MLAGVMVERQAMALHHAGEVMGRETGADDRTEEIVVDLPKFQPPFDLFGRAAHGERRQGLDQIVVETLKGLF
jgi:hypothetical protein